VRLDDNNVGEGSVSGIGDIARREEKYLFIVGRACLDKIKSGGRKLSALDIGEAMVVGIADQDIGNELRP